MMVKRWIPKIFMLFLVIIAVLLMERGKPIVALLVLIIPTLLFFIWFLPIGPWLTARGASVKINFMDLVEMRFRRTNPSKVVHSLIKAQEAGLKVTVVQLESHCLAGGNIDQVVEALIMAREANIPLNWEYATAFDFMGGGRLDSADSINKALTEIKEENKKRQAQLEQENKERQAQLEQEDKEGQEQLEQEDLQKMYIWKGKSKIKP